MLTQVAVDRGIDRWEQVLSTAGHAHKKVHAQHAKTRLLRQCDQISVTSFSQCTDLRAIVWPTQLMNLGGHGLALRFA